MGDWARTDVERGGNFPRSVERSMPARGAARGNQGASALGKV